MYREISLRQYSLLLFQDSHHPPLCSSTATCLCLDVSWQRGTEVRMKPHMFMQGKMSSCWERGNVEVHISVHIGIFFLSRILLLIPLQHLFDFLPHTLLPTISLQQLCDDFVASVSVCLLQNLLFAREADPVMRVLVVVLVADQG